MICPNCKQENEDDRPLEIDEKIVLSGCQDCWEEQCDKEWWVEIQRWGAVIRNEQRAGL